MDTQKYIDIVFERRPYPDVDLTFVEVEDQNRHSIKIGEWVTRPDGHLVLRIPDTREAA